MNQQLQESADAAIAAYREEIDEWSADVPIWTARSRKRLTILIALGAPEFFIKREIAMLRERIDRMKAARLGGLPSVP
jgi:hypothetical protein